MKIFRFLCMLMAVVASSCNKDDVITVTFDDDYYRAATDESKAEFSKVFEYTPAPGQFIGDTKTGGFSGEEVTTADAVSYAFGRLTDGKFVSLGGFGGYVIVGFDHSIDNSVGYDLAIGGNSFNGSSEPGVVWVMQDENGDGEPNDVWYELRGSESGAATTLHNYSVTYFRPTAAGQPVKWSDSEGAEGEIDYLSSYHTQDYYYPQWVKEDSYTLSGTRLAARNYDSSGNGTMWVQPAYGWGYADNFSDEDHTLEGGNMNLFDIANAIDSEGKAKELKYIDFVKVQTAVNAKSGWLGELSTEVTGFYDYRLMMK